MRSSYDCVVNKALRKKQAQPKGGKVASPDVVTAKTGHTKNAAVRAKPAARKGDTTMKVYPLQVRPIARDAQVYVGIDAAAESLAICVLGSNREVLAREVVPNSEAGVHALVQRLPGCLIQAAYEAGPTGYRLLRWLRGAGCQRAFMAAPSKIPVANGERIKTDQRDALKLATLLATGQLDATRINDLSDEEYADRQLVRSREQMARKKTAIMLQIKSLMLMHHIQLPADIKPTWGKRMRTWLETVDTGHVALNQALREQLLWLSEATSAIKRLDKCCQELSRQPRYAAGLELLRSIPGIGLLTGMVVLTELPNLVDRFERGEALARYLGLVPTEHSTGKSQGRRGHLTHDGNVLVRTALVEASWRLISKDEPTRSRYENLKRRCGGKKAAVATARHLAMTIYAMFRDHKPYRRPNKEVRQAA